MHKPHSLATLPIVHLQEGKVILLLKNVNRRPLRDEAVANKIL